MSERGRPRTFDRTAALKQAMHVFWAKDYDGASLADLTQAMGINPPSLYAAFGSKEQLFREAVALYGQTEGTGIWQALQEGPTARQAVQRFLERTAESVTQPGKPPGCLVVLGVLHPNEGNQHLWQELRDARQATVRALRERLRQAVRDGELPAGTDCEVITRFYAAVQHGMAIQARDGASRAELLAVARGAMAAWDGLVSAARGASRASRRTSRKPAAGRGRAKTAAR
ncbi:MAG TPA: TetR/AcrR family transcriptional regulator [Vicinamibacterales bacterium]